jgi:Ala-tRNA(Pro) deacylase
MAVFFDDILPFLDQHNIVYTRFDHPPVFTCEDANKHLSHVPGLGTKNLFLRDKTGKRHFLVSVPDWKVVELKSLATKIGVDRLSFASTDRLKRLLGVDPGSVTLLGLINDRELLVEVFIDEALWKAEAVHCHPLVNTSSLLLTPKELERFFALTAHQVQLIDIPSKENCI